MTSATGTFWRAQCFWCGYEFTSSASATLNWTQEHECRARRHRERVYSIERREMR